VFSMTFFSRSPAQSFLFEISKKINAKYLGNIRTSEVTVVEVELKDLYTISLCVYSLSRIWLGTFARIEIIV
jgi:hypothetical protein